MNLHHDPVTTSKGVISIGQVKGDCGWPVGNEWFRLFKTIPVLAAEWLAAHKLLIPAHPYSVHGWPLTLWKRGLRVIARIDIDHLYHEI